MARRYSRSELPSDSEVRRREREEDSLYEYLSSFEAGALLTWFPHATKEGVRELRRFAEEGAVSWDELLARALRKAAGQDRWGHWAGLLQILSPPSHVRERAALAYLDLLPFQPALAGEIVFGFLASGLVERAEFDACIDELARQLIAETFRSGLRPWHRIPGKEDAWRHPLSTIAERDARSREVLLDACLDGAARATHRGAGAAFLRLVDSLDPTPDERCVRTERYLALIGSGATPCIDAGLAFAEQAYADRALEPEAFAGALLPLVCGRSRARARAAIATLELLADEASDVRAVVIAVLVQGLVTRDSTDVQTTILDLLANLAENGRVEALGPIVAGLAPSLRGRASALAGVAWPEAQRSERGDIAPPPAARRLDPRLARLAGVTASRASFSRLEVPCLDPAERIEPFTDVGDLLELIYEIVGTLAYQPGAERALDGIARLCHHPLDGDRGNQLRAALEKRRKRRQSDLSRRSHERWWVVAAARAWATGLTPSPHAWPLLQPNLVFGTNGWTAPENTVDLFLERRAAAIADRAAFGLAAPLLGTPTQRNGFIDPVELVERFIEHRRRGVAVDPFDLILALVRLAPERRSAADNLLQGVDDDHVDLLRHALGGPVLKEPSSVSDFDSEDLSLHAPPPQAPRNPFTDPLPTDSEQAEVMASIHDAYRQARESALWRTADDAASGRLEHALWRAADHARSPTAQAARPEIVPMPAGSVPCVLVRWEPALPTRLAVSDLVSLLARPHQAGSTVSPGNIDAVHAHGCLRLALYLDGFSERGQAARTLDQSCHAFLEPLIDPDEPLTDVALVLLALGIASKRASTAGTATDIARFAIDDGRLDPTALTSAIAQVAATGALRWSRLAARLADIAVVSELHSQVVRETVVALIAQDAPPVDADAVRLLQFLHERSIEDGVRIEDAHARAWLARFTGSGKTAKAAHALLALHTCQDHGRAARAATRRHRGRRDRAARWSGQA